MKSLIGIGTKLHGVGVTGAISIGWNTRLWDKTAIFQSFSITHHWWSHMAIHHKVLIPLEDSCANFSVLAYNLWPEESYSELCVLVWFQINKQTK